MYDKKKIPFWNRLPITKIKLFIARILYSISKFIFRKDKHLIRRKGINYEVDLSEGIDLSLFLFGNFQGYISNNKYFPLPNDAIIFDIGANIGSMTFSFAQLAPNGYVYAFEPTDYAFNKLIRNISLNNELAKHIIPIQIFLSNQSKANHKMIAYSSWKVDGKTSDKHSLHGGIIKSANSIPTTTIDDFSKDREIRRLDLIKIDTDGYELQILLGAKKTLEKYLPYIIFEIGLYIIEEKGITFNEYFKYLSSLGYTLINSKNGKTITLENFYKEIPLYSTTDIIAIPSN